MENTQKENSAFAKCGEQWAAPEIWRQLRAELAEPISEAHAIIREYGGVSEYGIKFGLDKMNRRRRQDQIMFRPANFEQFIIGFKQLKSVEHSDSCEELFRQLIAGISQRFMFSLQKVLTLSIQSIESKQRQAIEAEKKMFVDIGLEHQKTSITAGVNAIASRLASLQKFFATASYEYPIPCEAHAPELFEEESKKWKAELAAIEKSGDYSITVANSVRFGPDFKHKIKGDSVWCDLEVETSTEGLPKPEAP